MATRKRSSKPKAYQHKVQPKRKPVNSQDVHLEQGKGSKGRGGDPGGFYWHIYVAEKRAGYVFINIIDEPPLSEHASLQISLNKTEQGKHIGRIAYRLACEQSEYDTVYAHMRKSNIASRRAAEEAGFQMVQDKDVSQLVMVWRQQSSNASSTTVTIASPDRASSISKC